MSYETDRTAIRTRLSNYWRRTTAIAWDAFNGSEYTRSADTEFIRPRIEDGEANWKGIGGINRRARKYSTLVIEVFQPIGSGDTRGAQLCDSLIAGFTPSPNAELGVSFWRRAWAEDVGSDGTFHKWIVFAPFYSEETVSVPVEPDEEVEVLQTVTSHGFVAKDLIRWDGSTWVKALATAATTLADAIVTSVVNANQFQILYLHETEASILAHGLGSGGTKLYLSAATAGAITTTAPSSSGQFVQQIGRVKDANTLILQSTPAEVAA